MNTRGCGVCHEVLQQDVFYGFCFATKEERTKFSTFERIVTLIGILSVSLGINMILAGSQRLEYYVCQCIQQDAYLDSTNVLDYKLMNDQIYDLFTDKCPKQERNSATDKKNDFLLKRCCHSLVWEMDQDPEYLRNYDPCNSPTYYIENHEIFSFRWFTQKLYQATIVGIFSFASLILLVKFVLKMRCEYCNKIMYLLVMCQILVAIMATFIFSSTGPMNFDPQVITNVLISYGITILIFNPLIALFLKCVCLRCCKKNI